MTKPADPKRLKKIKKLIAQGVPKTKIAKDLRISRQRLYQIIGAEK